MAVVKIADYGYAQDCLLISKGEGIFMTETEIRHTHENIDECWEIIGSAEKDCPWCTGRQDRRCFPTNSYPCKGTGKVPRFEVARKDCPCIAHDDTQWLACFACGYGRSTGNAFHHSPECSHCGGKGWVVNPDVVGLINAIVRDFGRYDEITLWNDNNGIVVCMTVNGTDYEATSDDLDHAFVAALCEMLGADQANGSC